MAKHHTFEEKKYILSFLNHGLSKKEVADKFNINVTTIKTWFQRYMFLGDSGLRPRNYTYFTKEFKLKIIDEYLNTKTSLPFLRDKYNLSNVGLLYNWVNHYTSGQEIKTTRKGDSMKNGRKTTLEERIEIVNWVIAHDDDFSGAVSKFKVSYGQVYSWVKKMKLRGPEGLIDHRGRGESTSDALTTEKIKDLEIKRLKEQVAYLSTENNVLKKLEEIERRSALNRQNILPLKNYHKK